MANQTSRSIVTSIPLRNASVMYKPPGFVATEVFKQIDVNDPKAKITKYLASDFFRREGNLQRGEKGRAKRGDFKTTDVTFSAIEYAFAHEISDERRRNSKKQGCSPIDPDLKGMQLMKWKMLMEKEYAVAQQVVTGTWGDGNSGGEDAAGLWAASSTTNTFITDIDNGLKTLAEKGIISGPDFEVRLLMDDYTFRAVKETDTITERIKYVTDKVVTPAVLANMFMGLDRIIVPQSVYSSAKETKAGTEFTAARFWEINSTKGVAFLYAFPKTSLAMDMMCAGLIVRDKFDDEEGGQHERLMKWREPAEHMDVYELAENRDEIQVCADAAYLWKDTVTT